MKAKFGPGGNSDAFRLAGFTSTLDAPAWLSKIGLDAYEYEAGNGLAASAPTLAAIGRVASENNIKMSYHTPYFISLSGVVEEKRLKSIDYIRQSIEAARLLGADTIVVHCGSCAKISRDEAMRLSADTLVRAAASIDTYGIKIGLETMGKINQLGTLDEVIELCKIAKCYHPVVDFGHLNARNVGGYFTDVDSYRRVFNTIAEGLGDEYAYNLHCHFSKIEYTSAGEKKHLTFDDSVYGPAFEPLVEAIVRERVAPRIICESAGTMAEDALAMKNYFNSLIGEK